jgi:hypothetical protein
LDLPIEIGADGSQCTRVDLEEGTYTFFPIARLSQWEDEEFQMYDDTALALIYSLASFFTLVTAFAAYQLGYLILTKRVTLKRLSSTLLIVFLFLFNLGIL